MKISLGADPEFMLTDSHGSLRSAIGIVKGTKEKKVSLGNGHLMFYDNVLVEVNIVPGNNSQEVITNFGDCLKRLSKAVHPYRLNLRASAKYPESECQHDDAKVFGCEPEYDAYELQQVMAPVCEDTFRSAGGHMHLGVKKESWPLLSPIGKDGDRMERDWGRVWVVRMLDLFVGVPSLFIDQDPTSPARRRLYGKAGTHRPKEEYGVEYRATSNFWLASPKLVSLMYDLCSFTTDFVAANDHKKLWKVGEAGEATCTAYKVDDLQKAINETNKDIAGKLLKGVLKEQMPRALYARVLEACEPNKNNFQREWGF